MAMREVTAWMMQGFAGLPAQQQQRNSLMVRHVLQPVGSGTRTGYRSSRSVFMKVKEFNGSVWEHWSCLSNGKSASGWKPMGGIGSGYERKWGYCRSPMG